MISRQFHIVIGNQLCSIRIEITRKIEALGRTSLSPEIMVPPSRVDSSVSVREGTTTGSARVSFSNGPSHSVVLLSADPWRSYTWRTVDQQKSTGQERATSPVSTEVQPHLISLLGTGLTGESEKKTQVILGETKATTHMEKEGSGRRRIEEELLTFPFLKISPKPLSHGKKCKSPD